MKKFLVLFTLVALMSLAYYSSRRVHAASTVVTFDTNQVSCAGTVTSLVAQSPQRTGLLITNPGAVAVYLGNSAVTTGTGAYLPGGGSVSIPTKDAVSCISSGAAQTLTYLETYNTF